VAESGACGLCYGRSGAVGVRGEGGEQVLSVSVPHIQLCMSIVH
jgi:hypothetical protein